MAQKHWSADMFVLCWSDSNSKMRKRMSWHTDRDKLETMAASLPACVDPVLYNGFGSRLVLGPGSAPKPKRPKKPKGKRRPKLAALPVAA